MKLISHSSVDLTLIGNYVLAYTFLVFHLSRSS